jgi:hypothetical protein
MADLDSDEDHTGSDSGDARGAGEGLGRDDHLRLLDPTARTAAAARWRYSSQFHSDEL